MSTYMIPWWRWAPRLEIATGTAEIMAMGSSKKPLGATANCRTETGQGARTTSNYWRCGLSVYIVDLIPWIGGGNSLDESRGHRGDGCHYEHGNGLPHESNEGAGYISQRPPLQEVQLVSLHL